VWKDWAPKTILATRRIIDTKLGPLLPVPLDKLRAPVLDTLYAILRTWWYTPLWSRESPWKWLMFNTATKASPGDFQRVRSSPPPCLR